MLAVIIGLTSGGAMAVAVSGVWVALHIPARLQERLRVGSSWPMTWALVLGLILSAVHNALGVGARLPWWVGCAGLALSGVFVGMLASALGEILQAVPVLRQRLQLEESPVWYRLAMILGKAVGAVIAGIAIVQ